MRGVIMETKNGRAVLLTKGGEFVNIKDKGYSVGDKVNITSDTGRLCAMAASLVIVCAGVSSYFMPAGYVSVDINPSLMMTLNMYNRVIDVTSFNDDARVLLNKTDIKGKSAEKSVEMLINASEEIGYINDNNRDVILEVVPGIRKPNMDGIKHKNIELTNEIADKETLRVAQDIGVSIAKAKAIEEYTKENGGDVRSNAAKFNDKSVKEIRNIMLDKGHLSDKKISDMPPENPKPQENKKQNEYRTPENISLRGGNKPQEIPQALSELPHRDIIQTNQPLQIEPKPQGKPPEQDDNILQSEPQQIGEPAKEKPPVDSKPIQMEQKPQEDTFNQIDSKPQKVTSKSSELKHEGNKSSGSKQQITEQKPQDNIPNKSDESLTNNPAQSDGQHHEEALPSDNRPSAEQKPNAPEQDNDKPQSNPYEPTEPKREPIQEQSGQPSQSDRDTYKPQNNPQPGEPKREDTSPQNKQPQQSEPKQPSGGDYMPNEGMGGHNEIREMP